MTSLAPPEQTPAHLVDPLNDEQRAAVLHPSGPALILAGAGSGKTRALTHRVAALIERGAPPWQVLALTFTNKAAREMRERAVQLSPSAERVTLTTFHAFGALFLRQHAQRFGRSERFTIYDKEDQMRLLKSVAEQAGANLERADLDVLKSAIERAKHRGQDGAQADCPLWTRSRPDLTGSKSSFALGGAYEGALKAADAFDFGDLIIRPFEALQDPELRALVRARWRWILVDEFQDTNIAQLKLLQALCPSDGELLVVGDDDQSIYGWRGAEVDNILRFSSYFPGARVYKLERNYRSKGNILKAANGVIRHNSGRLGKTLWTSADAGARVRLYHAEDERDEARYVGREVRRLIDSGACQASEVAVLYRANHLTLPLERAFSEPSVRLPYVVVRGQAFFERAEVKDALSYLRLLVNPNDLIAFTRATSTPSRGVGAKTIDVVRETSETHQVHLFEAARLSVEFGWVKGRAREGLRRFYELYTEGEHLLHATMVAQAEALLRQSRLFDPERAELERDEQERGRMENILQLLETVRAYEDAEGGGARDPMASATEGPSWFGYLEQVKLIAGADEVEGARSSQERVSLMTIHASKGLEFPYVFVVGLEEGIFPASSAGDDERRLEEERRLFYVALTRAERHLTLSFARRRALFGGAPKEQSLSVFLSEVDRSIIEPCYPSAMGRFHQQRRSPMTAERRVAQGDRRGYRDAKPTSQPSSQRTSLARRAPKPRPVQLPPSAPTASSMRSSTGVKFEVGLRVKHRSFGEGEVLTLSLRSGRATALVRLDSGAEKSILLDFLTPT